MKPSFCLLTIILAASLAKADKSTPADNASPADQLRSQALSGRSAYELAYYDRDDEDKNKDQDNDKEKGPGKGKGKGKAKGKAKGLRENREGDEQGNEKNEGAAPGAAPAAAPTTSATAPGTAPTTAPAPAPVAVPGAKPQVVAPAPPSAPVLHPAISTPTTTAPATARKAAVPAGNVTTAPAPATPTPSVPARSPAQVKSEVNRSFNRLGTLASERKASATAGLAAISKETGVPVATLEEQRKKHGSSYGGLFMANELAKATGKPADAFYRQRAQGRDWERMAEENKVEMANVLPKLQRVEQSMEAARKR